VSVEVAPALSELIARYAGMVAGEGRLTASVRGMRFNELIADVLRRDGIEAEANVRGPRGEVDVAFALDGPRYLLEAKWEADPIDSDPIRRRRYVPAHQRASVALVSAGRRPGFSAA